MNSHGYFCWANIQHLRLVTSYGGCSHPLKSSSKGRKNKKKFAPSSPFTFKYIIFNLIFSQQQKISCPQITCTTVCTCTSFTNCVLYSIVWSRCWVCVNRSAKVQWKRNISKQKLNCFSPLSFVVQAASSILFVLLSLYFAFAYCAPQRTNYT